MKKHINIPIFIPHYGCPNACVFCNQVRITGKPCFEAADVTAEIDNALATVDHSVTEAELAFFGGSFTAIPRNEMLSLLSISDKYLKSGKISSVRLSTRPDAIDDEVLGILKEHGVRTIELGIQSMSENVLSACKRGHSIADTEKACSLVKKYGFQLVGQMMVGLPSSTPDDEIATAKLISDMQADGARIYPTVVLPSTALAEMEKRGEYTALTINDAAERCANVLSVFAERGVRVIRIGLCANEILATDASPTSYHAAIGELARSLLYRKKMEQLLSAETEKYELTGKTAVFEVPKGKISQAIGQKRSNAVYLCQKFKLSEVKAVEGPELEEFSVTLRPLHK